MTLFTQEEYQCFLAANFVPQINYVGTITGKVVLTDACSLYCLVIASTGCYVGTKPGTMVAFPLRSCGRFEKDQIVTYWYDHSGNWGVRLVSQ